MAVKLTVMSASSGTTVPTPVGLLAASSKLSGGGCGWFCQSAGGTQSEAAAPGTGEVPAMTASCTPLASMVEAAVLLPRPAVTSRPGVGGKATRLVSLV